MVKILLILTALLGVFALWSGYSPGTGNPYYSEICVDGVVYLRSYNGNLTPKINAEFYPYTCVKGVTNNG